MLTCTPLPVFSFGASRYPPSHQNCLDNYLCEYSRRNVGGHRISAIQDSLDDKMRTRFDTFHAFEPEQAKYDIIFVVRQSKCFISPRVLTYFS